MLNNIAFIGGIHGVGKSTICRHTGKSIHYDGKTFQTLGGRAFKANYFDVDSGDHYWISGCKKDGSDRLYGERLPINIDEDAKEEYWTQVRNMPTNAHLTIINGK